MTEQSGETWWKWNPRIATRSLEGTAFVLHSGRMLSLNDVGTRVWELFKDGATLQSVAHVIVDEFEVTAAVAQSDVQRFVADLLERQLLVPCAQQ